MADTPQLENFVSDLRQQVQILEDTLTLIREQVRRYDALGIVDQLYAMDVANPPEGFQGGNAEISTQDVRDTVFAARAVVAYHDNTAGATPPAGDYGVNLIKLLLTP